MSVKLTSFYCVPKYTFFNWGFNARTMDPESSSNDEYVKFFDLLGKKQTVSISLQIGKIKYPASISLSRPSAGKSEKSGEWKAYHRIRFTWDRKHTTKKALRKMFIYSYVTTIDKGTPDLKELAEFEHIAGSEFRIKAIGRQVTPFDDMFQFMEDKNLFAFWKDRNDTEKSPEMFLNNAIEPIWRTIDEFDKFKNRTHVIYLLHHSGKNQIYIGKANEFGKRVNKGKEHQGIAEGWDRFMFFELDPEFIQLYKLELLEDFAIRLFTSILENNYNVMQLNSEPELVNEAPLRKK